jgi:hypothetical protein
VEAVTIWAPVKYNIVGFIYLTFKL